MSKERVDQMIRESNPRYKVENSAGTKRADAALDILGRQMELNPTKTLPIDEAKELVGHE